MTQETPLLTAAQVAEILNTSTESVRRWAREGLLAAVTLPSGHKRFRRSDVESLLRAGAA